MSRTGRRTAVVERRWIGGSCPNINCLPSKNEIWSAKVASLVCHGAVASAPGGFLEGRCLRMAPYVTGTGAMEETTAPPEDANVGYPLGSARSLPRRAPDRATSSFPLSSPDLHCQAGCHHWVLYWIRDRGVGLSSFVFRFGLS